MLITKQNIKDLVQFTLNIEDRIIEPNINDAQEYDLLPIIGDKMFDKLILDFDGGQTDWDILTNYAIGQFVIKNKKAYKALTINIGSDPETNPLDWQLNELGTFMYKYLRPYLVHSTYRRYLLWIGREITQYGLREMREDTSDPVSDIARASLISDEKVKMNVWFSRIDNELCKTNRTFDGTQYLVDCTVYKVPTTATFNIRAIK